MEKIISPELEEYNRIYKESEDFYHEIALRLHLSDSAFTILYSIFCLGDGCLQKEICSTAYISKQTVNSAIHKLEQEGYLRLKPGKGRDMHIHLTASGKKLTRDTILPVIEMENRAFAKMKESERTQLLQLSRKYMDYLREESKETL